MFSRFFHVIKRSAAYATGLAALLTPNVSLADIELTFGSYTADKPTEVVRQFKPILNYLSADLSDRLGDTVTIKMRIAKSYEEGNADLVEGRVDFARFGPASYVLAKDANDRIGIIAMETKKGLKTSPGIIAIHTDSTIASLKDLQGGSFAFGDASSTIGRFLAQEQLLNVGITAATLAEFDYLGRHDRVGTAVGQGAYDAGALKESTFKKLQEKGVPIKALIDFPNVTKPWLHSANVDPAVVDALQAAMVNITDADILSTFSKSGFVLGTDADYAPIRDAMTSSKGFGG